MDKFLSVFEPLAFTCCLSTFTSFGDCDSSLLPSCTPFRVQLCSVVSFQIFDPVLRLRTFSVHMLLRQPLTLRRQSTSLIQKVLPTLFVFFLLFVFALHNLQLRFRRKPLLIDCSVCLRTFNAFLSYSVNSSTLGISSLTQYFFPSSFVFRPRRTVLQPQLSYNAIDIQPSLAQSAYPRTQCPATRR